MRYKKPCHVCGGILEKVNAHDWYCQNCHVLKTRINGKWKVLKIVKDYLAEVHGVHIRKYYYLNGKGVWK